MPAPSRAILLSLVLAFILAGPTSASFAEARSATPPENSGAHPLYSTAVSELAQARASLQTLRTADARTQSGSSPLGGPTCEGCVAAPPAADPAGTAPANWSPILVTPPARETPGLVYDPQLLGVLMFGGNAPGGGLLNDTWLFQNSTWTQLYPADSPPVTNIPQMVYDAGDGYVLLLWPSSANQSWTYTDGDWSPVTFASGPEWRYGEALSYDTNDSEVVLFGGANQTSVLLNDTWTYHAGTWTRVVTAAAPSPRSWATLNDDPWDGGALLVGGNLAVDASPPPISNDTWRFAAGGWVRLADTLPPAYLQTWEPGYTAPFLAPDPGLQGVALLGWCLNATSCGAAYDNITTWRFAGGAWGVYSTTFVANYSTTGLVPDWLDDGLLAVGLTWREPEAATEFGSAVLSTQGWMAVPQAYSPYDEPFTNPPPNWPMTYDAADGYVFMVGGWDFWNDTTFGSPEHIISYAFANGRWSRILTNAGPTPRSGESLAYDSTDGYVLLFGGQSVELNSANGATWSYRNAVWTPLYFNDTGSAPPDRIDATMVDDPADHDVVLFGGESDAYGEVGGERNDTWAYSAGNWTNITPVRSPAPRMNAAGAYDAPAGEVVLFGGQGGNRSTAWLADTWTFAAGNWTNLSAELTTHPSPRASAALAPDPADDGLLLFGGEEGLLQVGCCGEDLRVFYDDSWVFNDGGWTNVTDRSSASPAARQWPGLVDDVGDGYVLYFGSELFGVDDYPAANAAEFGQTWSWASGTPTPFTLDGLTVSPSPAEVGVPFNVSFGVVGGQPPYEDGYGPLPPGCSESDSNPLTCTPTTPGNYSIEARVFDALGRASSASVRLVIAPRLSAVSVSWGTPTLPINRSATFQVNWTGGIGPYRVDVANLPAGCPDGNAAVFSCVPDAPGTYPVTVTLTDSLGATASGHATVVVYVPASVTSVQLQISPELVLAGDPVHVSTIASGPSALPLSYAYSGLPAGCVGTNDSNWSCDPWESGTFLPEVLVQDPLGDRSQGAGALTVLPQPALSVGAFYASPESVPVNASVTIVAIVDGGVPPVAVNVTGFPPGCPADVHGSVTCRPSEVGNYTLTLTATDASGARVSAVNVSLAVAPVPTPSAPAPGPAPSPGGSAPPTILLLGAGAVGFLLGAGGLGLAWGLRRRRPPATGRTDPTRPIPPASVAPPPVARHAPDDG